MRRSKSYADGSTQRCNALLERSNGQAGVHNIFEEYAQGFDQNDESGDAEIQSRQISFRPAPKAVGDGAVKSSNEMIAQFMQLRRAANPAHAT